LKFISDNKITEQENRKKFYLPMLELVKKNYPDSKFKETHFHWYLSRCSRQQKLKLETDHIVSVPLVNKKNDKKIIKKIKIKKIK